MKSDFYIIEEIFQVAKSIKVKLKKEGKDVYVIALNESAQGFYEHIGFEFTENISFIERK